MVLADDYEQNYILNTADLGKDNIILGQDWLKEVNPTINWSRSTINIKGHHNKFINALVTDDIVSFFRKHPKVIPPEKATEGSAGFDLAVDLAYSITPGGYAKVQTGIIFNIPKGYHGILYLQSSWATELSVFNGVIDSDYVGELIFLL